MKVLELNYWRKGYRTVYYMDVIDPNVFELLYVNESVTSHGHTVRHRHYEKVTLAGLEESENVMDIYRKVADNAETVWLEAPNRQRFTFLRNLIIYAQSEFNYIPLYRLVRSVYFELDDVKGYRSVNSVIKNIYANKRSYSSVLRRIFSSSPSAGNLRVII